MSEDIEAKATELGWVPQDQFRGDPEKWVDAETFVKRGEELVPLLKATTRRQSEELATLKSQLKETRESLNAATEAIEALKETTSKAALDKVREHERSLKRELVNAREEGDIEREEEVREKLQETREAIKASQVPQKTVKTAAADEEPAKPNPTDDPHFSKWLSNNPWFTKDKRKTALALGIADDLRDKGVNTYGEEFYSRLDQEMNEMLGIKDPREAVGKVEEGGRHTASSRNGKTFADLPDEAKAACERVADKVVGKNRAYKDMDSWRKAYADQYYAAE